VSGVACGNGACRKNDRRVQSCGPLLPTHTENATAAAAATHERACAHEEVGLLVAVALDRAGGRAARIDRRQRRAETARNRDDGPLGVAVGAGGQVTLVLHRPSGAAKGDVRHPVGQMGADGHWTSSFNRFTAW
jgi:hypothetical protein